MAKGVEYLTLDGSRRFVSVKREVILSAGAIASPQILMLSGIGPADELRKHQVLFAPFVVLSSKRSKFLQSEARSTHFNQDPIATIFI